MSEEEEVAAAGLVVVLVRKPREQDDGIRRTFQRHKNIGATFTSGDESNMKARGSRGTSHSSMCADQAAALKSFLFLYPFNTQGIYADSEEEESVAQDVDAVVFVMVWTCFCHTQLIATHKRVASKQLFITKQFLHATNILSRNTIVQILSSCNLYV